MYQKIIEELILPKDFKQYMLEDKGKTAEAMKLDTSESYILASETPGTGKTYASLSLMAKRIHDGLEEITYDTEFGIKAIHFDRLPKFISQKSITEHIETIKFERYSDKAYGAQMTLDSCREIEYLIIDDLWAEKSTQLRESTIRQEIYDIVDTRYNGGLTTIVTTNLTETQIASFYGDRVLSRLLGMCEWIPFNGKDLRNEQ